MDLRLLGYFVAIADAGSVSGAVTATHVTQPVLSRQLVRLERSLGLTLFDRRHGRLELSGAGRQFLPVARDLLRRAADAQDAAASIVSGRLTSIALAVPTTTLTDVLAPFLATLEPDDPTPSVRAVDPQGALASLRAGADLAIVTTPPPRSLTARRLAVLPVHAYVRADDPWAGREEVTTAELASRALILLSRGFRARVLIDAAMDAGATPYGRVTEVTDAQVAQALCAAGRGVAVVSDDPRFDLVPVGIATERGRLHLRLYAAWDAEHHAAASLAAFAERISGFCVARYGARVAPARQTLRR